MIRRSHRRQGSRDPIQRDLSTVEDGVLGGVGGLSSEHPRRAGAGQGCHRMEAVSQAAAAASVGRANDRARFGGGGDDVGAIDRERG